MKKRFFRAGIYSCILLLLCSCVNRYKDPVELKPSGEAVGVEQLPQQTDAEPESTMAGENDAAGDQTQIKQAEDTSGSDGELGKEKEEQSESEDDREKKLDLTELRPQMPENTELISVLDKLMPDITGQCATTTEKVRAIYDYLINTCSYSDTIKYDYETDAVKLLKECKGSCTYYVAAMHYMLLYIGVDNRIVNGYRYLEGENGIRTSFHRWIEITLDGTSYMFDPQWEDSMTLEKVGIQYERFFKTHEELSAYYAF